MVQRTYLKCPVCGLNQPIGRWKNTKKKTTPRDHELIMTKEQRPRGNNPGFHKIPEESVPITDVLTEEEISFLDQIKEKLIQNI